MLLTIKELTVKTNNQTLINNVSFSIYKEEWFALVGQSGSGKSVLSQAIGQMLSPNLYAEGSILFQEEDLLSLSKKRMRTIRGKKIAYVFQDYQGSFTPFRTIGQHYDEFQKVHQRLSKTERKARALDSLQSVGLDAKLFDQYPSQLSGGQLQRVSIAMALLESPDLLIADEITTALDSITGHRVLELLAKKREETGCSILFITHDWRHVRRYANRIAIMKDGEIVETGGKHRILDHPVHPYTKQLIDAAPILGKGLRSGL